jgi:tartrate-resistant acid phosphatase type 5
LRNPLPKSTPPRACKSSGIVVSAKIGTTNDFVSIFDHTGLEFFNLFLVFFFFFAVLGNHDYRGNAEAQLSLHLRKIDSRWLCLRSFIVDAGV